MENKIRIKNKFTNKKRGWKVFLDFVLVASLNKIERIITNYIKNDRFILDVKHNEFNVIKCRHWTWSAWLREGKDDRGDKKPLKINHSLHAWSQGYLFFLWCWRAKGKSMWGVFKTHSKLHVAICSVFKLYMKELYPQS